MKKIGGLLETIMRNMVRAFLRGINLLRCDVNFLLEFNLDFYIKYFLSIVKLLLLIITLSIFNFYPEFIIHK